MIFSKHANQRCQQRGIPHHIACLIENYGTPKDKPGGAKQYILRKKDVAELIRKSYKFISELERCRNKAIVVSDVGTVITVYIKK